MAESEKFVQAHLQRLERDVKALKDQVSLTIALNDTTAVVRIEETFRGKPGRQLAMRGLQEEMAQSAIAAACRQRGLKMDQPRVSRTLESLLDQGFVARHPDGRLVVRPGWEAFDLARRLRRMLTDAGISDLK